MNDNLELKQEIENLITNFVEAYDSSCEALVPKLWRTPIIGYADVNHPYVQKLPEIVRDTFQMPKDVLPEATIILCCFVPFTKEVAVSNKTADPLASSAWAQAYEYTNAMFPKLNEAIIQFLKSKGYKAMIAPESLIFDSKILKSNWSHRHFAYASGIGTFGLNNMLITRAGCSGRLTTIVTNLDVVAGKPMEKEQCLYKSRGKCGVCVRHCPTGALTFEGYDRVKCYAKCWENALVHTQFGSSYLTSDGDENAVGSEVCGKCVTYAPCTYYPI